MEALFQKIQLRIQDLDTSRHMECWLQDVGLTKDPNGNLILLCPNAFSMRWLEKNHSELLKNMFSEEIGREVTLTFQLNQESSTFPLRNEGKIATPPSLLPSESTKASRGGETVPATDKPCPATPFPEWNPQFTFSTFVSGPSNGFAWSAARELSRQFRRQYNPFLIHGSTGLGKTHLGQAIGHALFQQDPNLRIFYSSAENFFTEMIHHIKKRTILSFKEKYRQGCDVFILDDLQFLPGKNALQSELCYTIDSLVNQGKQVILLGNLTSRNNNGLDENLNSRIFSGLSISIEPPDYETRLALVRQFSQTYETTLSEEALVNLAQRTCSHVRALEGTLKRLTAMHTFSLQPINAETILDQLHDEPYSSKKPLTLKIIKDHIANYFAIDHQTLSSRSRKKKVLHPRQIGMYLSRKYTEESLETIGSLYNRDHSSVLYAVKSLEKKMTLNSRINREVQFIEEKLLEKL